MHRPHSRASCKLIRGSVCVAGRIALLVARLQAQGLPVSWLDRHIFCLELETAGGCERIRSLTFRNRQEHGADDSRPSHQRNALPEASLSLGALVRNYREFGRAELPDRKARRRKHCRKERTEKLAQEGARQDIRHRILVLIFIIIIKTPTPQPASSTTKLHRSADQVSPSLPLQLFLARNWRRSCDFSTSN